MEPKSFGKSSSLMAEFKSLLVSSNVQKIQFRFGATQIWPLDFRHLASRLTADDSHVSLCVDEGGMKKKGSLASYEPSGNKFTFRSELVFRNPEGCAHAVHESVHAIFDLRDRVSMSLNEEAACFLAEAMYHVIGGTESIFLAKDSAEILDVAAAVCGRSRGSIPEVTLSERLTIRNRLRKGYGYSRGLDGRGRGFKSNYG